MIGRIPRLGSGQELDGLGSRRVARSTWRFRAPSLTSAGFDPHQRHPWPFRADFIAQLEACADPCGVLLLCQGSQLAGLLPKEASDEIAEQALGDRLPLACSNL